MVSFALGLLFSSIICILEFKILILFGIAFILLAIPLTDKGRFFKFMLVGFIIGALSFEAHNLLNDEINLAKSEQEFQATLLENEVRYDDYSSAVCNATIDGESFKTKVYFENSGDELRISDKISGDGYVYIPYSKEGFDRLNYYKSEGINVLISAENIELIYTEEFSFWRFLDDLRINMSETITNVFGENSGFVKALTMGDKEELSTKFSIDVNKIGISHVLVVSGMHIAFLGAICLKIAGKGFGFYVSLVVITLFALTIGLSPSVIRACVMQYIMILAWFLSKEYSSKNALSLAFIGLMILNPYIIFDVGFVLSFLSSFAIIFVLPSIYSSIKCENRKINKWLLEPMSLYISVFLVTFIPIVYYFDVVSTMTFLSNLIILPLIVILFPICIITILFGAINIQFGRIIAILPNVLIELIEWIITKLAEFEYALSRPIITDICVFLIIAICLFGAIKFDLFKKTTIFVAFLTIIGYSFYLSVGYADTYKINIFSVGDGQTILIDSKDEIILIDIGSTSYKNPSEIVENYAFTYGIEEIDHLIITSIDNSHIKNINSLNIPVKNLVIPEKVSSKVGEEHLNEYLSSYTGNINGELPDYIEINRNIDKKIAVKFGNYITLHAFTSKMIEEFIQYSDFEADTIILADKAIEEYGMLENQLETMGAKQVILSNDYENLSKVSGYNARTTIGEGDIFLKVEDLYE